MSNTAGKAAVRCQALDMSGLAAMERHGKRQDRTSTLRRIRQADPLVYKTLDLRPAYEAHVRGTKQNSGAKKPVLHFIIRFPPELLIDHAVGKFQGSKQDRLRMMLVQAVDFINKTHGGQAVFAARIDRDEAGETIVDVFAAPRYEKRTKRTEPDRPGQIWTSATKFGRELAEKHQAEIMRRHPEAKSTKLTGPRMVGIALQSEFALYFRKVNGIPLTPKEQKKTSAPDRFEVEAYKDLQVKTADLRKAAEVTAEVRAQYVRADAAFRAEADRLASERVTLDEERASLEVEKRKLHEEKAELAEQLSIVRSLRNHIEDLGSRMAAWIFRMSPKDPDRSLGVGLLREVRSINPAKKPSEESLGDGPGL